MAGYIVSLKDEDSLRRCINIGCYSTNLSKPKNGNWLIHHEGTFADYFGMNSGDNIYFFINRKIYGIGELINIKWKCSYLNYPNADVANIYDYENIKKMMLLDSIENLDNRCICLFKPNPNFFINGVDMDDVLSSNPSKFRMLRAFWKLSFIKIDDEENKALKDILLKRNEEYIYKRSNSFEYSDRFHKIIELKIKPEYIMESNNILKNCFESNKIKHEMAIEAAIIDNINKNDNSIFGKWDYISHQVIASPFKPIDYMDKMDVFGYRYIEGFDTISKYLVIEIKKDIASKEAIDQIMKYVDWINQEYSFGDYSTIKAFIVAYNFPQEVIQYKEEVCIRNYTKGRRPTVAKTWTDIELIYYRFENNTIKFYRSNS
ncbi:hypothetical protein NNC19_18015 [Clostridium sp. SHJSY1]|uniref:hypothetical protein n=1 Tax=Clostridium sp. SHJSY1 TaxID=2942483 RepID=UPI0028763863|nr:hypothetical protein [Clostridium sp. SHJSY1]MDS0527590.1 hypothetical protein [Clostridium sp. SHJSY1]